MAWYDDILGSGMNVFGASAPSYLKNTSPTEGLLSDAELAQLNSKSMRQGLLTTALTYLAQPKNQRYGSALPYLAKAGIAGTGAAQNVYDQATQDYINASKLQEIKQKKDADKAWSLIQNQIYTKTPDVTKQVTTAGGYAPSMDQVAPEQATPIPSLLTSAPTQLVQPSMQQSNLLSEQPMDANAPPNAPTISTAPNFNMVQQPDVTTTQVVQAGKPTLNSDLIQQFVTQYPSDERAQKLLANMEALKKLNTAEKGSHVLSDLEKQKNKLTVDGTETGEPLKGTWQIDSTGKIDQVSGTEVKVPEFVQLQQRIALLTANNADHKNDVAIQEIQSKINHENGTDQDPPIVLDKDTRIMMAKTAMETGVYPPFGMGKNASNARMQFYNDLKDYGLSTGVKLDEISKMIADNKISYAAKGKALKDLTSGQTSINIRRLGVANSHLNILGELATALNNNDILAVNRLRILWKTETGNEAPTNFEAAKQIVGDEIVASIVPRGGSESDRQAMKDTFKTIYSLRQLLGAISTEKKLLGGQLAGIRDQAIGNGLEDNFNKLVSPTTLAELPQPNRAPTSTSGSPSLSNKNQPMPIAPKIGEVRNGWKFKGGNPADKNSWEK